MNKLKNTLDWLLIIGVSLSPMTLLRIFKVGPAEILIIVWCFFILFTYKKVKIKNDIFFSFWIVFISLITLGSLVPLIIGGPVSGVLRDILTYTYFTVFITSLIIFYQNSSQDKILSILKRTFLSSGIIYLFLFCYGSFISSSFLGMNLWFGGIRFSGGAINPHQLAFLTGPMIGIGFYLITHTKKNRVKLAYLSVIISFLIISINTESSTLIAALFIQLLVYLTLVIVSKGGVRQRIIKSLGLLSFIAIIIWMLQNYLLRLFWGFINSDPNGYGRIELVLQSFEIFKMSPIIGLGYGAHIPKIDGGIMETHNLYMEILLNSGLLGLINLLILFLVLLKTFANKKIEFSLVIFFMIYGLGGYGLRRIIFWFILITLFYLIKNAKLTREKKTGS